MTREPTEMELRVAEVLKEALGKALDATSISTGHGDWTAIGGGSIDLVDLASAAIRAMREPTNAMKLVIGVNIMFGDGSLSEDWHAMIDAASPPEPKP